MQIMMLWRPVLEIALLTVFFYYLILFIKGSPVVPVLKVLVVLFICFFVAHRLQLHTISWVLTKVFAILVIALLIIFQPELRRALVHLGGGKFFGFSGVHKENIIDEITEAVVVLSRRKVGALIAIERDIGLKNFIETGVRMNSIVTSELITTIFTPTTVLHDGGIIIQEDIIAAAACIFPLPQNFSFDREMGTRHQAAIGLTEETDAMVFIVSEETGTISLAHRGKLSRGLDDKSIKRVLTNIYTKPKRKLFGKKTVV